MSQMMNAGFWGSHALDSRTDKKKVTIPEMALGYFLGPLLVLAMTSVVATYYLTFYRTYDDVVSTGTFLVLLPLVSVIPMAISNIVVGIVLGRTRTPQGKARPFILTAAPLLLVSPILMFCIPYFSMGFRMVWMAISYNLFAALANPIYTNAHYLMVSVSTRDLDARGQLSVVSNIPAVAGNGLISSIVMPMILAWINSAPANNVVQNRWQFIMVMFGVLAFIGCVLEYFFTRERVTEEDLDAEQSAEGEEAAIVPTSEQLRGATHDRFWWIIMVFYFLYQAGVMFKGGYVFNIYCHMFFEQVTVFGQTLTADMVQSVLALISGVPLAAGMLFIWPLANKFGKRNVIVAGCVVSILGSVVCLTAPDNFIVVLIGQTLKGFSSIPGAYIMMALFADVLDHLEAKLGYRVDGISMSVYTAILTVVNGLAVAVFNFFYDNAAFVAADVTKFFFLGYEIPAHAILIVVLMFLTVEKCIKEEQELIAARKGHAAE